MIYPWQQSQWQHIAKLLSTKRLPHAMMLTGNNGLGKTDFALSLAHSILCTQPTTDYKSCGQCKPCQLLRAGTHPDLHHIKPSTPTKSKSANPILSIKVDTIRDLCNQLNQTSHFGLYRVALIEQADYLTLSAANSLLKTLEEPGQNVLILIVTSRPHRLPVTIRSRCQTLRFLPPEEKMSLDWLQQHQKSERPNSELCNSELPNEQYTALQLKLALKQTYGSPLSALQQLCEIEHHELLATAMMAKISGKNSLNCAAKLAKFSKVKTLEGMLSWSSDLSKILACGLAADIVNEPERKRLQALAVKVNQQRLFQFQDQLNFNLLHSTIAVNEQLLWENLLLSWDNL